jgi:hypothetical protein
LTEAKKRREEKGGEELEGRIEDTHLDPIHSGGGD